MSRYLKTAEPYMCTERATGDPDHRIAYKYLVCVFSESHSYLERTRAVPNELVQVYCGFESPFPWILCLARLMANTCHRGTEHLPQQQRQPVHIGTASSCNSVCTPHPAICTPRMCGTTQSLRPPSQFRQYAQCPTIFRPSWIRFGRVHRAVGNLSRLRYLLRGKVLTRAANLRCVELL
jgi:hypothetical protein